MTAEATEQSYGEAPETQQSHGEAPEKQQSHGEAPEKQQSYGDALDELEALLDELEGSDVDVDVLAERVARGVELIRLCRARLDVVTADVGAVVAELAERPSESEESA